MWFATVIGAANGSLWPGLLGLMVFLLVHYLYSETAGADFLLAACTISVGLVCETVFVRAGLLLYPADALAVAGVPLWVLILWANFALIMNGCLSWLHGRYLLSAALGFLGGPLSYYGGIKLGAATAGHSLSMVLTGIAICYAIVTPLFLYMAQRLARYVRTRPG